MNTVKRSLLFFLGYCLAATLLHGCRGPEPLSSLSSSPDAYPSKTENHLEAKDRNTVNWLGQLYNRALHSTPDTASLYLDSLTSFTPMMLNTAQFLPKDRAKWFMLMGSLSFRSDREDDALLSYRTALKYDYSLSEAYNNIGFLLMKRERFSEARVHFLNALKLDATYTRAQENLEMCRLMAEGVFRFSSYELALKARDAVPVDRKIAFLEEALALSPHFHDARNALAVAYYASNEPLKALELLDILLKRDSLNAQGFNNFGVILFSLGKSEQAISAFSRSLSLNPSYYLASVNLTRAYISTGNYGEAKKAAEQSLRLAQRLSLSEEESQALIGEISKYFRTESPR